MQTLAYAKINLTLDVHTRRADGYHNISTVMQTINLHDVITVELQTDSKEINISVVGQFANGVPSDSTNIAYKAADYFRRSASSDAGFTIDIVKNIPNQAGLGGGSSDAASVLLACNSLMNNPLKPTELNQMAARIGADVPFFLHGGLCLCEGIGEKIMRLPNISVIYGVIVKPDVGISTKAAYDALDHARMGQRLVAQREWDRVTFRNDFEEIVLGLAPEIQKIKESLIQAGCSQSLLCGSGSAVFGVCDQSQQAPILQKLNALFLGEVMPFHTVNATII